MNYMKITPTSISTKVTRFIERKKFEKENKFINKFVHLDLRLENDTYDKLYEARKTIANYASSKGVTVDISDARQMVGELDSPKLENYLSSKLNLTVTDILTNENEQRLLSSQVNATYPTETRTLFVVDDLKEDLQMGEKIKNTHEDSFLRHIYRNIADMIKEIQAKK